MASWFKHIPDLELTVINHSNLYQWVGDTYDIEQLKSYSLPMQSDAISAAVLARHGGMFIDCDTILTRNPVEFLEAAPQNAVRCFGIPNAKRFHVAILSVAKPNNRLVTRWMSEVAVRLGQSGQSVGWNHLGGQILDPLLDGGNYSSDIEIIDRKASGNILESTYDLAGGQGINSYKELYFQENNVSLNDALDSVRDGMISLHNSWTPKSYSGLESHEQVLSQRNLLSEILHEVSDPTLARYVEEMYL